MARKELQIAVIGGGIGGLTAALSLRRAGFGVDIYEQAPALTHIGGGINMGPNAARVLIRLGLGEGLLREGVRPASTHQRRWDDGPHRSEERRVGKECGSRSWRERQKQNVMDRDS